MKLFVTLLFVTVTAISHSQTISVMDFVKVKNNNYAETMYYYESNWKLSRDIAMEKGFISGYRLEKVIPDSAVLFDLILITEYKDKNAYQKSEENFSGILKAIRPNGPVLLNNLKPAEFRQNVFVKVTESVYTNKRN